MNLKKYISSMLAIVTAVAAVSLLASCADMESHDKKSMLTASGFKTLTPTTPLQKEVYSQMPSYHVQRITRGNQTIYAYKDEQAGIAYVGREPEYQAYRNKCIEKRIAQDYYMAAQMDRAYSSHWYGAWGYGPW
jgi:hypothetical protein